jgi:hypothetical protein
MLTKTSELVNIWSFFCKLLVPSRITKRSSESSNTVGGGVLSALLGAVFHFGVVPRFFTQFYTSKLVLEGAIGAGTNLFLNQNIVQYKDT